MDLYLALLTMKDRTVASFWREEANLCGLVTSFLPSVEKYARYLLYIGITTTKGWTWLTIPLAQLRFTFSFIVRLITSQLLSSYLKIDVVFEFDSRW